MPSPPLHARWVNMLQRVVTKASLLNKNVSLRKVHHQLNSIPLPLEHTLPLNVMYIRFPSLLPIAALMAVVAGVPDALEVRNGRQPVQRRYSAVLQQCPS